MKRFLFIAFLLPYLLFSQNYNLNLIGEYSWPNTEGSDIWGWVDPLDGSEYALVGLNDGFSCVNLSTPSNPIEEFYITDLNSTWRDIKTWGNYAYVTTEADAGLLIVDLATSISGNLTYWHISNFLGVNGDSIEFTAAHNIYIDENGIAYIFGASSNTGSSPSDGAIFLDVDADPINPVYLGEWDEQYIHDGMTRGDTLFAGCIYTGELYVIDVSDKNSPVTMGTHITPNAFTHNAWVSDNGNFVFTTDEQSDSYIAAYDITDVSNIQEVDRIQSNPGSLSIPHNTHFDNNFLITSWYRDGTTVHDVTYPNNMIQVAYYDSYVGSGNGFDGCWGTYPFLPSGLIISSDINSSVNQSGKLLVYGRDFNQACYLQGTVSDAITLNPISGATIEILNTFIPNTSSSNLLGNYSSGTADAANYDVVFSKPGYVTDTLNATLNNGILTILDVALQPLTPINFNGTVVDTSGNGIPNVDVVVYNDDFTFNLVTDINGDFNINTMYEGSYDIVSGSWGYITYCSNEYIDGSSPIIITLQEGYYDDFTFDFGWTVSGGIIQTDDGMWERGFSQGTSDNQGQDYNPYGDVIGDCMDFAYVTGLDAGSQIGSNDVDDSNTILTSPIFDLSSNQMYSLSYYSWFQNNFPWGGGANDTLTVKISNGTTLVELETMTSASPDLGQWNLRTFDLDQYIPLTSTMQLIIEIADWDYNGGHWVEGGFDMFQIISSSPTEIQQVSIEENSRIIKVIDVLGRELEPIKNTSLFYIYEDGIVRKKILID